MKNDIIPVILGATEGAYALARSFYHDYGIRPLVMDESPSPLFSHTAVARFCVLPHLSRPQILYRALSDLYEEDKRRCYMLLPATEGYLSCVREREEWLSRMFLMPHLPTVEEKEALHDPVAAIFLYRPTDGNAVIAFADVVAKTAREEPFVLMASACPDEIRSAIDALSAELTRGCYLFYLDRDEDDYSLVMESDPLSPLLSLTLAHDISIPEILIHECVLCEPAHLPEEGLYGAWSFFPYRKARRFVEPSVRSRLRALYRQGNFPSLYSFKNERFSFSLKRIFDSFYLRIAAKKEK